MSDDTCIGSSILFGILFSAVLLWFIPMNRTWNPFIQIIGFYSISIIGLTVGTVFSMLVLSLFVDVDMENLGRYVPKSENKEIAKNIVAKVKKELTVSRISKIME